VLAVDGGNVKTDLALLDSDGGLLALVRGGRSSPHHLGLDGCVELLQALLHEAMARAGLDGDPESQVATAQIMVAGADLPEELSALRARIASLRWSRRLSVDNDTFALLRSGTERGWGVAVVCGGGINCVGVGRDGQHTRFLSLGQISGDWGGGYDVGLAALSAAARSADGRGPKTSLEEAVPAFFGQPDVFAVTRSVHLRELPAGRLGELAEVVFAHADEDAVAEQIVARLADEVVAMATVAIERLDLAGQDPDVVLGGGLMRAASAEIIERIQRDVRALAPAARVLLAPSAPIVGAALLGLDDLGVNGEAAQRAASELQAAFVEIEGAGARSSNGRITAVGPRAVQTSGGTHG
jgi:N-acetylglucosamine kinase-like BadF-type ATPase